MLTQGLIIGALTVTQPSIIPEYGKAVMDVGHPIENLTPGGAMSTTIQSPILEYAKILNDAYRKQYVTDPSR